MSCSVISDEILSVKLTHSFLRSSKQRLDFIEKTGFFDIRVRLQAVIVWSFELYLAEVLYMSKSLKLPVTIDGQIRSLFF